MISDKSIAVVRAARDARKAVRDLNALRAMSCYLKGVDIWGGSISEPKRRRDRAYRCLLAVKPEVITYVEAEGDRRMGRK